jgi:enoyl-CoA hydratase/carnithine racemase
MQTSYETLLAVAVAPDVLLVTLNRPQAANAFNTAMATEIAQLFGSLAADDAPWRCAVLTGSGARAFCAGADLKERSGMTDAAWRAQHRMIERMVRAIVACPVPVIAAVNGAAFGGGCELALACDFIYAAPDASFALPEVTRGIMPGAGGTQTLPRAIGSRRALELLLTGRPLTAHEALGCGLVNAVPGGRLLEAALATAAIIARNAPLSVREIRRAVAEGAALPLSEALAVELEGYNRLVPTEDRREGVLAFNERRTPQFRGR